MFETSEFFELEGLEHRELFVADEQVWSPLSRLKEYLASFFDGSWPLQGRSGTVEQPLAVVGGEVIDGVEVKPDGPKGRIQAYRDGELLEVAAVIMAGAYLFDDQVILGPRTVVEPGALVRGPLVVGGDTEIRQGAYVRGSCLVGSGCVVGHATEMKASIMLDGAKAGHFAYIGDSILGRDVNLGAGTKLANLKMIPGNVSVREAGERVDTGRRKLGAIIGDRVELGCNSVTSPGTFLGPQAIVYPALAVPGGYYAAKTVIRPQRGALNILSR